MHVQRSGADDLAVGGLGDTELLHRPVEVDALLAEQDSSGDERLDECEDLRHVARARAAHREVGHPFIVLRRRSRDRLDDGTFRMHRPGRHERGERRAHPLQVADAFVELVELRGDLVGDVTEGDELGLVREPQHVAHLPEREAEVLRSTDEPHATCRIGVNSRYPAAERRAGATSPCRS